MQYPPGASGTDVENRAAFMVQLHALLVQTKHIASENQRGKFQDILADIEEWVKELSAVEAPRPFVAIPSDSTGATTASRELRVVEEEGEQQQGLVEVDKNMDDENTKADRSLSRNDRASASTSVAALPSVLTPHSDEHSNFTLGMHPKTNTMVSVGCLNGMTTCSSDIGSRNLEDFAHFISKLFAVSVPENPRLHRIGRNASRLSIVRCFSIIVTALEQAARGAYYETPEVEGSFGRSSCKDCSNMRSLLFMRLSHDITVSVNTISKCLDLLTSQRDSASMRFAAQVSVDILKQLRYCTIFFQQQVLREELRHLRVTEDALGESSDKSCLSAPKVHQIAERRAKELRLQFGPGLLASVNHLMSLIPPALSYLVSLLSWKEITGSQEGRSFSNDVCANLFGLAEWMTPTALSKRRKRQSPLQEPLACESLPLKEYGANAVREQLLFDCATQSTSLPEMENFAMGNSQSYHIALLVLNSVLPTSFSPEYISCLAQHCGSKSEGQLVAVRILNDTVTMLAQVNTEELRHMLGCTTWRKCMAEGILNCLVSLESVVLDVGLDTLHRIVVGCPEFLGSEVGFLYTSCIFGLLESDNTPPAMRRAMLLHVINTLFRAPEIPGQPSHLLRLYQHFDLNVRWHQLNVVQQAVSTLSKAVRCATPEEFAGIGGPRGDISGAMRSPQKSLPYLALQGLSLAVELLAVHVHKGGDIPEGRPLPMLNNRERKMEEQRMIDVINTSPVKGVRKLFGVTDEEMNPSKGHDVKEQNLAFKDIPPPASPAVEEKLHCIAQFLMETPSLKLDSISEFLSHPSVHSLQVCQVFMGALPLVGKSLVGGLKELFSVVQPPKEGQRIERLLEFFCGTYFRENSVGGVSIDTFPFRSENACFIVGVAVLMLNTNLHNPHVSSEKMTAATFHAQLRGCNEGEDFSIRFTENIFDEISVRPLSGMKGLWPAVVGSANVGQASGLFPRKIDSIFFSTEERRELAFDAELQRLKTETRELVFRSSRMEPLVEEKTPEFWYIVAQDLFLSMWPSLCAVFGVATHGAQVPEDAQLLCVRGLQSSFLVGATLNLQTECSVSQLALLRMSSLEPLGDMCHSFVLEVAASPVSLHFSTQCWVPVVELLAAFYKEEQQQQQQHPMQMGVESVFGRVEEFTRVSCGNSIGNVSTTSVAVEAILKAISSLLVDQSIDSPTLIATLHVLRRFLSYSPVSCDQQQDRGGVKKLINTHGFSSIVMPALVDGVDVQRAKGDECLHALVGFVVDVLSAVWSSSRIRGEESSHSVLQTFAAESYTFFQLCYRRCETSTVVRMHLLQGIKELLACTLHMEGSSKRGLGGGFYTRHQLQMMAQMWQRLLQPVARALSEKDTIGTETCSLAVHVFRKLVALCCGVGTPTVQIQLQKRLRNTLLLLLSEVAYVGGMCSDVDSSHSCLEQLSIICTTALKQDETAPNEASMTSEGHPMASRNDVTAEKKVHLLHCLVGSVQQDPDVLLLYALERICLLLQCQTQQTRTEVVSALRVLVMQLQPSHLRHLAAHLSNAVLEASLVHAGPDCGPTLVNPSLVGYALFDIYVPPGTKRICSPTLFSATLPLVMNFMSHELLSSDHPELIAEIVMKRCMLPLAVSPNSSAQTRTVAVRSLMHCASLCAARQTANDDNSFLDVVADCVSLILLALRIPVGLIVPKGADHTGHGWVEEKRSVSLTAYMQEGSDAIQALCSIGAHMVTGIRSCTTLHFGDELDDVVATAIIENRQVLGSSLEREELARSLRSTWPPPHGDVVTDEQLVEYCMLMTQLLSPLPKVLGVAPPLIHEGSSGIGIKQQQGQQESIVWTPPPVAHQVFSELLLEAAGIFFAILWRVNHFVEMEEFMAKLTQMGRDAPLLGKSSALLPHAAIRGGLNAFAALVMRTDLSKFREVVLEVLQVTAVVQMSTLNTWEAQKMADGATEKNAARCLNPQERQHIRSCNVGMYQELSAAVSYWMKIIEQQTDDRVSTLSATQREELVRVACDAEVFRGFVRLLTVTAGTIITTTRDYLAWYITACNKKSEPVANEGHFLDGVPVHSYTKNGRDANA